MRRHLLDLIILFVGYLDGRRLHRRRPTERAQRHAPRVRVRRRRPAHARRRRRRSATRSRAASAPSSTQRSRRRRDRRRSSARDREARARGDARHASAYDLHFRLLPHLREIAQARLERAGRTPGPDTLGRWWELLRPDRPAPEIGSPRASRRPNCVTSSPTLRGCDRDDGSRRGRRLSQRASSTRSRRPSSASARRSSC